MEFAFRCRLAAGGEASKGRRGLLRGGVSALVSLLLLLGARRQLRFALAQPPNAGGLGALRCLRAGAFPFTISAFTSSPHASVSSSSDMSIASSSFGARLLGGVAGVARAGAGAGTCCVLVGLVAVGRAALVRGGSAVSDCALLAACGAAVRARCR